MIVSKYSRNSSIHRTLEHLVQIPMTAIYLRPMITNESMSRFLESCIQPLMNDGYIEKDGMLMRATEKGREKYKEMGPVKKRLPQIVTKNWMTTPAYDGAELKRNPVRPGSDDFLNVPSLMGDKRVYRDGRVEEA